MISVAIKKASADQSEEAKILRDNMLGSILKNYTAQDVKIASGGKPYLENGNVGFSISHSNDAVLSAVNYHKDVPPQKDALNLYFEGGNNFEVGADIEALGKRNCERLEKVSEKYFSDAEKQLIKNADNKELAFLEVWTKKEAYLKLTGVGIKGISSADTQVLKKDYIFYSEKVSLGGLEFIVSVSVKR